LISVIFESGSQLQSFEYDAFRGTGLTTITIPASVTSIDNDVFKNINSLTITVEDGNTMDPSISSVCANGSCYGASSVTVIGFGVPDDTTGTTTPTTGSYVIWNSHPKSKECKFPRKPLRKGAKTITLLASGITTSSIIANTIYSIIIAPKDITEVTIRTKFIKSDFDKNQIKGMNTKFDRQAYRKSVIDIAKTVVSVDPLTKEEVKSHINQDPPELPDDKHDYFGINSPAPLNPIDYSIYKNLRIEMLTKTDDNKLVVNSCQKLIPINQVTSSTSDNGDGSNTNAS
jgi:hypothetical protein